MPIPSAMVTRFFQLISNRQFAEAERELQRLKQRMDKNRWNEGYFKALSGILISTKSNDDQYSFLSKINPNDGKLLREYRKEFLKQVNNRLQDEYDRGFFSAWADYIRVLIKMHRENMKEQKVNDPPKKQERRKGQTSIEHFVGTS